MARNAKRENPQHQHPENSELEVMRAKVRKLEATVKELQVIKEDQVDHRLPRKPRKSKAKRS